MIDNISQNRKNQDDEISRDESLTAPAGPLLIAICQSGSKLAKRVIELLKNENIVQVHGEHLIFLEDIDFQFSDGETCVRLEEDVNGRDVFLF